MSSYFNDSPIESSNEDAYGITPFAQSLAKSILTIKKPVGTTIALNGPWGSGKSSAVNLIRNELQQSDNERLVVTDFRCWWYRGEEALALAFFQNLHATLVDSLGDKVKDLIPKIGRGLLQAGPVIGPAVTLATTGPLGALAAGSTLFAKRFFPDGDSLEKTFKRLADTLANEDRRFLVIIDDIDRLNPDEALAIFRLVKSVGHLPNVIYLLVFDRVLAEKAVDEKYPSEGPHFLEKIIQAGFELPQPLQVDLNAAVLGAIERVCGAPDESQMTRIMNNFYDIVVPYVTTPRHVVRYQNAISVTWPAIAGDVSMADFIALETIRLYEPRLFITIRANKSKLCGFRQEGDADQRDNSRFDDYLVGIDESHHDSVKIALQRLFPRLESMGYAGEMPWDSERRICVDKHFDTYFRLSLSDDALSSDRISEVVTHAGDREYIQLVMRAAADSTRKDGSSLVPVYLNELTTNARKIAKEQVAPLLSALFEIHDEIDMERDKERGFYAVGDTTLRYHWLIRRLTSDRYSLDERTELYESTMQHASLGWLVDFASSAMDDYRERENGPKDEDRCLISKEAVPYITDLALERIRTAAENGSLISHPDLVYILYRWRDFLGGDPTEARSWTQTVLGDDEAVVAFAVDFTGESWSHGIGMFGLGDRVSTRHIQAQISDDTDIIDTKLFRSRLEQIRDSDKLSKESMDAVVVFLDAWEKKQHGED